MDHPLFESCIIFLNLEFLKVPVPPAQVLPPTCGLLSSLPCFGLISNIQTHLNIQTSERLKWRVKKYTSCRHSGMIQSFKTPFEHSAAIPLCSKPYLLRPVLGIAPSTPFPPPCDFGCSGLPSPSRPRMYSHSTIPSLNTYQFQTFKTVQTFQTFKHLKHISSPHVQPSHSQGVSKHFTNPPTLLTHTDISVHIYNII